MCNDAPAGRHASYFSVAFAATAPAAAPVAAPFVPLIGESTVATILSPGRFVAVQTRPPDVIVIPVPAPISREGARAGAGEGIGADGCGRGVASSGGCAGDIVRSRRVVRV